jgi:hypothetical protein
VGILEAATHPALISQSRIAQLAAGGAEWTDMKQFCDKNLARLLDPGYAGWGWRTAVENYATAYLYPTCERRPDFPTRATYFISAGASS